MTQVDQACLSLGLVFPLVLPSSERWSPRSTILPALSFQVRSQALLFIKRMYEKEQLREYVEKFALNYLQLLVHPNPPSVLFGADKDTGLAQLHQMDIEHPLDPRLPARPWEWSWFEAGLCSAS